MLNAPDPFCQLSTDGDSHLCFGFLFQKGGRLSQATGSWLTRSVLTAFAWFCRSSVPWSSLCPLQIWLTHFRFFAPFVQPAVNHHERAEWEYSCIEWSSPAQTILSQGSPSLSPNRNMSHSTTSPPPPPILACCLFVAAPCTHSGERKALTIAIPYSFK